MKRIALVLNILVVLAMVLAATSSAYAGAPRPTQPPASVTGSKLSEAVTADNVQKKINPSLTANKGPVEVTFRLSIPAAVELVAQGMEATPSYVVGPADQRLQLFKVKTQQSKFIAAALKIDPSAKPLGSTTRVMNAVFMKVDAAKLSSLAAISGVVKVNPIVNYQYDMWNVVPWIGADKAFNTDGTALTGKGVVAAILDTGIDYTHKALGGSGSVDEFNAIDPKVVNPAYFPTAKVIGGYDFVGEVWPNGALQPDPNPIDHVYGSGYPHGTHVSSTMGGVEVETPDGHTFRGVAPDVKFYAVKVCSSVSSSCSGMAMMEGLDFAADPNGDGKINDRVDIVNMSIGSSFGQAYEDDTSYATNQLSLVGTLVVCSAGNSGNIPYVTGTPGAALGALSTAATFNPAETAQYMTIVSPFSAKYGAVWQSWSAELTSPVEAEVVYGGSLGNKLGCTAFPDGSLAGKIALVDRGTCAISIKISNMAAAGALVGVVGLVAPGDPTSFAFGGGNPSIPGYNISQADATAIKTALLSGPVVARFDPTETKSLAGVIAGYSSRGPSMWLSYLKPDIAAPGNSYSAVAGTGNNYDFAGGTSFASPTAAGVAALLKQKYPNLRGYEIKSLMMGQTETNITTFSGAPAALARMGAGEVRANQAADAMALVYSRKVYPLQGVLVTSYQPSLSFLFNAVTEASTTLSQNVVVKNISNEDITFQVAPIFRDAATDAITFTFYAAPNSLTPDSTLLVPANSQKPFRVDMTIDGTKLQEWGWNTGALGVYGDVLKKFEYDGFIQLDGTTAGGEATSLKIPWYLLPRQSNNMSLSADAVTIDPNTGTADVDLTNNGVGQGYTDTYSLLAESPELPKPAMGSNEAVVDLKYFGVQTYAVPAGYCGAEAGFIWSFAINTWTPETVASYPAEFDIYLDTNNDGTPDYVLYNAENGGFAATGQNIVYALNLATGKASAFFYTDQGSNTGNFVFNICGDQIGMPNQSYFNTPVGISVYAFDNYFTGNLTDSIEGLTAAPMGERYYGMVNDVAPGTTETMTVYDLGATQVNPDLGVLAFVDAARGSVRAGAPNGNEALVVKVTP